MVATPQHQIQLLPADPVQNFTAQPQQIAETQLVGDHQQVNVTPPFGVGGAGAMEKNLGLRVEQAHHLLNRPNLLRTESYA